MYFQNTQPDTMDVAPEWDSLRSDRFWEEIADETHQRRVRDIQPKISGLGKLSGVHLGLVKVPQVAPGILIGGGIAVGAISGLASYAIFDSFGKEKGWGAAGLFAAGIVSGTILLCSFVSVFKGVLVAAGVVKPEAAKVDITNPETGASTTAVIQNPNLPASAPAVEVTSSTPAAA